MTFPSYPPPDQQGPGGYPQQPPNPAAGYPPQPSPTQPEYYPPQQQPGGYPAPPPDQYGGYPPQYQPMPPQPPQRTWLVPTIAIVLALAVLGGVGFFLLQASGDDEEPGALSQSDSADPGGESSDDDVTDGGPDSGGDGQTLSVPSAGAEVPSLAAPWQEIPDPAVPVFSSDQVAQYIPITEDWIASFYTGTLDVSVVPYTGPDDLETATAFLADFAFENYYLNTVGLTRDDPSFSSYSFGGRDGVIGEMQVSWDEPIGPGDLGEQVIVAVVDVDGLNAFGVIAGIPESAADQYDVAVQAVQAIQFTT